MSCSCFQVSALRIDVIQRLGQRQVRKT
jgi:hypothetical protein